MWFAVFFILPLAGLVYVAWHVWALLPVATVYRWCAVGVCILALAMMVMSFARVTEHVPLWMAKVVYNVGYPSLFIMLYAVMAFLLLDVLRLVHVVPRQWLYSNGTTATVLVLLIAAVFVYGNVHFHDRKCRTIGVETAKPLDVDVTVMLMSDLQLGYHIGPNELGRIVDVVNAARPDLVLIAGDLIDGSLRPLDEQRMAGILRSIKAPVYACPGNHEYYAGIDKSADFMRRAGITLLRDSVATEGNLVIIGRDDRTNRRRKSLGMLMKGVDRGRYTILMDHQPYHLEQAERAGVDFQLSGHTHHGQVWPISWITDAVYEVSHGTYRRGDTHYYVCPGVGLWGAKFRIGTDSEYGLLRLSNRD